MPENKPNHPHSIKELNKEIKHEAAEEIVIFGQKMHKAELFKLGGLIAFFVIILGVTAALWPMFGELFSPGGATKVVNQIRDAGPWGILVLLGLQFLQIVISFIPGEVVQFAAGILYGPWWGTVLIIFGAFISSLFIFELVHRLGRPFVEAMVSKKHLDKFHTFAESGKLRSLVFLLFLCPGMPKDVFTYIVPLTSMTRRDYLLITTFARVPGVFLSTYAAAGLFDGNATVSIVIYVGVTVIALAAILLKDKLTALFHKEKQTPEE